MKLKDKKTIWQGISVLICSIVLFSGFITLFSALWFRYIYGNLDFDSVLFTIFGNIEGSESTFLKSYVFNALLPALVSAILLCFLFFLKINKTISIEFFKKKIKLYPISRPIVLFISILLSLTIILTSFNFAGLTDYIIAKSQNGTLYEEKYISPSEVSIKFPENKRNLIYIFLESMESSYFPTQVGGGAEKNLIPELYNLGKENINFSQNDDVGGFYSPYGTTFTIAAMTSQTAGIHMQLPQNINNITLADYIKDFLPGVTTLNDILKNNGYHQTLMVGSDASYGGRREYFTQHGVDHVYDLFTAREEGIIPSDYHVWWGMEDEKLFEYAKIKLAEISKDTSRPFNFTMLTVDTHHVGGYVCSQCQNKHSEQYENVLSCSSKQVFNFIEWIQNQDFYSNTTIVICGDHATMDAEYMRNNISSTYSRHIYNCFINSAVDANKTKQRLATSFDMFPSTLAALGCEIKGEKLALGTNLFSNEKTLLEEIGSYDELNTKLSQNSNYYTKNFMY